MPLISTTTTASRTPHRRAAGTASAAHCLNGLGLHRLFAGLGILGASVAGACNLPSGLAAVPKLSGVEISRVPSVILPMGARSRRLSRRSTEDPKRPRLSQQPYLRQEPA